MRRRWARGRRLRRGAAPAPAPGGGCGGGGSGAEEAVRAFGEFAGIAQECGGDGRGGDGSAEARHAHERGGEGEGRRGVACDRRVIGSPFGEAGPGAFESREAVDSGQEAGRKQEEQALQIVVGAAVRFLVAGGGGGLFGGDGVEDGARDDESRTEMGRA